MVERAISSIDFHSLVDIERRIFALTNLFDLTCLSDDRHVLVISFYKEIFFPSKTFRYQPGPEFDGLVLKFFAGHFLKMCLELLCMR